MIKRKERKYVVAVILDKNEHSERSIHS